MRKSSTNPRKRRVIAILKPRGNFHDRVQAVGPEHFGIIPLDPAKRRSAVMASDFYGTILVKPFAVTQSRPSLQLMVENLRDQLAHREIKDVIVAIERTGRYHQASQPNTRRSVRYCWTQGLGQWIGGWSVFIPPSARGNRGMELRNRHNRYLLRRSLTVISLQPKELMMQIMALS
jgi:hypothetical protein